MGKNYLVSIVSHQTDLSIILLGQSSTELKKCLGVSINSLHLIMIYVKSSCALKYWRCGSLASYDERAVTDHLQSWFHISWGKDSSIPNQVSILNCDPVNITCSFGHLYVGKNENGELLGLGGVRQGSDLHNLVLLQVQPGRLQVKENQKGVHRDKGKSPLMDTLGWAWVVMWQILWVSPSDWGVTTSAPDFVSSWWKLDLNFISAGCVLANFARLLRYSRS